MAVLLSGPSYSSLGWTLVYPAWSTIPFSVNYTLMIGRLVVSVIYCDPWSCGVWRICSVAGVVCHGRTCGFVLGVLNRVVLSCFYGGCACPVVVIGSSLCASHDGWSYSVCCIVIWTSLFFLGHPSGS